MGVIHKFTKDVVDFILEQKKTNPSLSCRALAQYTSEKFQIKVSKSAINTIFKKEDLSNSVGRPSIVPKSGVVKKFQIPSQKKKQLFKNMEKIGFDLGVSKEPVSINEKIPAKEEPSKPIKVTVKKKKTFIEGAYCEAAGLVIFKAAQWELMATDFWQGLLQKYGKGTAGAIKNGVYCDIGVCLRILDMASIDSVTKHKNHGIFMLNTLARQEVQNDINIEGVKGGLEVIKNLRTTEKFFMDYFDKCKQVFQRVTAFKIECEDGTCLKMDAQMRTIWHDEHPAAFSLPIQKALTVLSCSIISNNQPIIIGELFHDEKNRGDDEDRLLERAVAIFESKLGKKIRKVSIFCGKNEKIAEFVEIPAIKRNFMIGVRPSHKIFRKIVENGWKSSRNIVLNGFLNENIYFSENSIEINGGELRVFSVWKEGNSGKEPDLAILSNCQRDSGVNIVTEFVQHWPYSSHKVTNSQHHLKNKKCCDQRPGDVVTDGLSKNPMANFDVFYDFSQHLKRYCEKYFFVQPQSNFNLSYLISMCYKIPGYVHATKEKLVVTLKDIHNTIPLKDLECIGETINERNILDNFGRRVWINIEKNRPPHLAD